MLNHNELREQIIMKGILRWKIMELRPKTLLLQRLWLQIKVNESNEVNEVKDKWLVEIMRLKITVKSRWTTD